MLQSRHWSNTLCAFVTRNITKYLLTTVKDNCIYIPIKICMYKTKKIWFHSIYSMLTLTNKVDFSSTNCINTSPCITQSLTTSFIMASHSVYILMCFVFSSQCELAMIYRYRYSGMFIWMNFLESNLYTQIGNTKRSKCTVLQCDVHVNYTHE